MDTRSVAILTIAATIGVAGCAQSPASEPSIEAGIVTFGEPGEGKTMVFVHWMNETEWQRPYWGVNASILERFPIMVDLLAAGATLGWSEYGAEIARVYRDTAEAFEFCRFLTYEAWTFPDGENGTKWSIAAWQQEGRVYSFDFWLEGNCY